MKGLEVESVHYHLDRASFPWLCLRHRSETWSSSIHDTTWLSRQILRTMRGVPATRTTALKLILSPHVQASESWHCPLSTHLMIVYDASGRKVYIKKHSLDPFCGSDRRLVETHCKEMSKDPCADYFNNIDIMKAIFR